MKLEAKPAIHRPLSHQEPPAGFTASDGWMDPADLDEYFQWTDDEESERLPTLIDFGAFDPGSRNPVMLEAQSAVQEHPHWLTIERGLSHFA